MIDRRSFFSRLVSWCLGLFILPKLKVPRLKECCGHWLPDRYSISYSVSYDGINADALDCMHDRIGDYVPVSIEFPDGTIIEFLGRIDSVEEWCTADALLIGEY